MLESSPRKQMPNPKEVFENPTEYWDFLTSNSDNEFENQHFDRKEAGRVAPNGSVKIDDIRSQIKECVSSFSNSNKDGGLLVVGISKHGEIKGTNHLSENQVNTLMAFQELKHQAATAKLVECNDSDGKSNNILLIFAPYIPNAICETLSNPSKAWIRHGKQNLPMTDEIKEQLKRDKKISNFEDTYCCEFHPDDLDNDVINEFRIKFLEHNPSYQLENQELLYQAGALRRNGTNYAFNNAGYLFFARNPQNRMPWAYIRLLRFNSSESEQNPTRLVNLDKDFTGPLPQQARQARTYFKESGIFKIYQQRKPDGGFLDIPEFPKIAIDEAIVNAVAHRDYGIQLPTECKYFRDAFIVENPGKVLQRDRDLPEEFSLDNTVLDSSPRNSKIIEWFKKMGNEDGASFVRAISEGTKRMRDEMAQAGLPAPAYSHSETRTQVTLFNNIEEREARIKAETIAANSTEYTNLFRMLFYRGKEKLDNLDITKYKQSEILAYLRDSLAAKGWYIDRFSFSKMIAHHQGSEMKIPQQVSPIFRFFPAYAFQIKKFQEDLYLCVDYTLEVKSIQRLNNLLRFIDKSDFRNTYAVAETDNNDTKWKKIKILSVDSEFARVLFLDLNLEEDIRHNKIIPELSISTLKNLLKKMGIQFDIDREIKVRSLLLDSNSSRERAQITIKVVNDLRKNIFPLRISDLIANLEETPTGLSRGVLPKTFQVWTLPEPSVEFGHRKETSNIREGITSFGSYEDAKKRIEIVPICLQTMRDSITELISRLKTGKYKYHGSERTFSSQFIYNSIITVDSPEKIISECKRLLDEHPEWKGNEKLDRIFLVHTPEKDYSLDDETSPYYQIKRFLFENGIPCQMVDTPTLLNPDWKDLNLALNIIAKCGITPWVLPDKIPDADFFIGLSFTKHRLNKSDRLIGYSTVFNSFGRWEFYSGNTDAFSYEERTKYFGLLTKQTLNRLSNLSENPSIYFHYSARFSREDRSAILAAAKEIRPHGTYSFVSINSHHNIRLYDNRPETDGSVARGSFVKLTNNKILVSTTGYNPFRKTLGTPKPLEIQIWIEKPNSILQPSPDLHSLASQILGLTKLNWASTDSLCAEPITTKYAGDIAYLTDAFLRQSRDFKLHAVLEKTPWFL